MLPSEKGKAIAESNLQSAFAEYVQNPCSDMIDVLEQAIVIYDAVAAGLPLEDAVMEYEQYVAEDGNMSRQLVAAEILCGDMYDSDRAIPDRLENRAGMILDRLERE